MSSPLDRLALLLRTAYIAAFVQGNPDPHHPPPEWQEAQHAGQSGWHQFAREALKLGLRGDGEKGPLFAHELAKLVEAMRTGQRKHAAHGSTLPWQEVEAMEREVDAAIVRVLHPEQVDVFGCWTPAKEPL